MEDYGTQQPEQQPVVSIHYVDSVTPAAHVTCSSSASSSSVAANADTTSSSYQPGAINIPLTYVSSSQIAFYYLPQELPPPYPSQENDSTVPHPVNPVWTTTTSPHHIPISSVSQPSSLLQPPPSPPPPYRPVPACYYRPSVMSVDAINGRETTSTPPADYLFFSIINVLCCCRLLGIVAIVKSVQVRIAIENSDVEAAERHSVSARVWNAAAVVTGGVIWSVIIVFLVVLMYAL